MKRKVIIYRTSLQGYGCFKSEIEVSDENFVSETNCSITIKEHSDFDYYGRVKQDICYATTIDEFLKLKNEWYNSHIEKIAKEMKETLDMAEKLRNE